jgi:hypothetical protein
MHVSTKTTRPITILKVPYHVTKMKIVLDMIRQSEKQIYRTNISINSVGGSIPPSPPSRFPARAQKLHVLAEAVHAYVS